MLFILNQYFPDNKSANRNHDTDMKYFSGNDTCKGNLSYHKAFAHLVVYLQEGLLGSQQRLHQLVQTRCMVLPL